MPREDSRFTLLLVDDEQLIISSLKRCFYDKNYSIHSALNGFDALKIVTKHKINLAFIDLKMPGMDGFTLLQKLKPISPDTLVLVLTGHGGIKEAVRAMQLGAFDFLEKPFSPEQINARVAQLATMWRVCQDNKRLKQKLHSQSGLSRITGSTETTSALKDIISQSSTSDAPVIIQGETGVGKELVARAIHDLSNRNKMRFVSIDCGTINEMVIESELFGHVKGAFTGAHNTTMGLIRTAHEGTLFLDEIGELPLSIQVKLLRTLQEGEVRPVGSEQTYNVNFRLVSATNRDLTIEVKNGSFRQDLFYRLNVILISVPPLRERREDIPELALHFIKQYRNKDSQVHDISTEAVDILLRYHWPGNIRELENVIRRSLAFTQNTIITPNDLPRQLFSPGVNAYPAQPTVVENGDRLEHYELAAIRNALLKSGNNRKRASQILGIGEATLYRKIDKYKLN